jgi:hypothetical protein
LEREAGATEAAMLLDRLQAGLTSAALELVDPELWVTMVSDIRLAFQPKARRDSIGEQIAGLSEEATFRRLVLYAAISVVPDAQLNEAATAQAIVLLEALRNARDAFISSAVAAWVVKYWRKVLTQRSFALSSPALLLQEFTSVGNGEDIASAVRVLLAAEVATGAHFSQSVRAGLRKFVDE